LYWIPVSSFPIPLQQRQWLMEFFDRFAALIVKPLGLRTEVFLQYKTVMDAQNIFQKTAFEFSPIAGLSRKPGVAVPGPLVMDDLQEVVSGEKEFKIREWLPEYCYWFLNKLERRQREEFLGYGGLSMISLKPDPKTVPPQLPFTETFKKKHKIFQTFDVDAVLSKTCALIDDFQGKSKELFATDLKEDPRYSGLLFVLPILCTADFFQRPAEECENWFKLWDVYVRESPDDKGIILASKLDIEEQLIDLLHQMKDKGQKYSES
ncbi:MAG TPA: hypothetical protein VGK36_26025, partial [Candidatus Angelobacter sp.]